MEPELTSEEIVRRAGELAHRLLTMPQVKRPARTEREVTQTSPASDEVGSDVPRHELILTGNTSYWSDSAVGLRREYGGHWVRSV